MKIRTVKYMLQEGFQNTYKNLLMTLASLTMVIASLLIFGIFLMVSINLSYNMVNIESQTEIVVILKSDIAEMETADIEQKIRNDSRVSTYRRVSKEEAFNELAENMLDSSLLKGLTPEFLYESFRIKLKDPEESGVFADELSQVSGIDEIEFPRELLRNINIILRWINIGSMLILALLLVISVSIIANTIKLTVFARRKEINIMKYIGASDWFIRWPFIFEGMIIGFAGSIVAFVLTSYLYNSLGAYVNSETVVNGVSLIKIMSLTNIGASIFLVYVIIGMVMGAVGSIISVRKHLNV